MNSTVRKQPVKLNAQLPTMSTARGKCLRCPWCFKRLDNHLRVSATCRDVSQRPVRQTSPPPTTMNTVNSNSTASNLNASATLPRNSLFMVSNNHDHTQKFVFYTRYISCCYNERNRNTTCNNHSPQTVS